MIAGRLWACVRLTLFASAGFFWIEPTCAQRAADNAGPSIAKTVRNSNEIYLGWRVFQDKCSRCHGPDALGTAKAPNLLERVKPMSSTRFIGTVLQRYSWLVPQSEVTESGSPDVLIQGIAERQIGGLAMPAWKDEPTVEAHVADLYDYLRARADGSLPAGPPPRLTGR